MKKAVLFPGQGSQAIGMGKDLYDNFSYVKDIFGEVNEVMGFDLSDIIFNGPEDKLTITSNTQPALMVVSIALLKVLEREFNLPIEKLADCVAGHSLGEYTALCAVESLSLADCAKVLKARGIAMTEAASENPGAMAAILGSTTEVLEEIVKESSTHEGCMCVIANDNSKGQVVISGNSAGIERAIASAWDREIKRTIKLPVSGAFHSPLMGSAKEKLALALEDVKILTPKLPIISNVTANVMEHDKIKDLLLEQLTGTVRFRESLINMNEKGVGEFTEIGAGKVLSGLVKRTLDGVKAANVSSLNDMDSFIKTIEE